MSFTITLNPITGEFDLVSNGGGSSGVSSVNGRTGGVILTKSDVSLSNVDNTSDANKPISTATQTALNAKENSITAGTTGQYYRGDKSWQILNKSAVGLNNVDNTSDANKPISTATQTALNGKENSVSLGTSSQYYRGDKTWETLDKTAVGLSNVDNTSDLSKPISISTQTALNAKEDTIANGTSSQYFRGDKTWQTLDKNAVSLTNVDNTSDANKPISTATQTALNAKENSITAGTTEQYYRGDKSWQTLDKNAVGLNNVNNTSDVNKPVSSATQTALNAKEDTIVAGTTEQYYRGDKSWQTLNKSAVGLNNVDNTSDLNKPISTATQTALNEKLSKNSPITASTGTKISYDINGLVTSSSSAALTDLSDVAVSTPIVDQLLRWNGTKWVNSTGAVVNAGPGITYFLTVTSAGVNSYDYMSKTPDSNSEVDESITISNTTQLLAEYLSDATIGKNIVDAGIWEFNLFSYVSNQSFQFIIDVYKRTSGGSETLLFSATSDSVSWTSTQLLTVTSVQPAFSCNSTDELAVKISVTTIKVGITCHLVHSGTTHYSHFHTPLVLSHNDIAGLQGGTSNQYYHLTSTEYTGTGSGVFVRATGATLTSPSISSPTGLTKADVGLSNVDNTSDVNKPISSATQAALDNKQNTISAGTSSQYFRGDKTWQTLDKSAVGLSNVDNTSDLNKPISTATQTALNGKYNNPAGSTSQYIRGDGSLASFPSLVTTLTGLSDVSISSPTNGESLVYDNATSKWKNKTVSAGNVSIGDITETSSSLLNNRNIPVSITSFAFSNSVVRSFEALVSIKIIASTSYYQVIKILGIQKDSDWEISQTSTGDSSPVLLSISSAGQMYYSSGDMSGFTSGEIRFRAITTSV